MLRVRALRSCWVVIQRRQIEFFEMTVTSECCYVSHTTDNMRHVDSGNMWRPSGKSASRHLCRHNRLYIEVLVLSVKKEKGPLYIC